VQRADQTVDQRARDVAHVDVVSKRPLRGPRTLTSTRKRCSKYRKPGSMPVLTLCCVVCVGIQPGAYASHSGGKRL
jgi:hypothetical protein